MVQLARAAAALEAGRRAALEAGIVVRPPAHSIIHAHIIHAHIIHARIIHAHTHPVRSNTI